MSSDIRVELCKFRVPLSQAWEEATAHIMAHHDIDEVERLVIEQAERANAVISQSTMLVSDPLDVSVLQLARDSAIASVQNKLSGQIPELPDRETDILTQHYTLWSLIGKLLQAGSASDSPFRAWVLEHALGLMSSNKNEEKCDWKPRCKNIVNALTCFKGTMDERITDCCLSDTFLSERDLVVPAVKLIVKSRRFKKLMGAPDMVSDGEKSLPKLLLKIANDKEFRQVFVWLPLDPESGGVGVMPSDKEDYRFVVSIIVKILFGKLRQRGQGIDKRSSFAERQNQIMSYIGTIPVGAMDIVFEILFGRIVSPKILSHLARVHPEWSAETREFTHGGIPILDKAALELNPKLRMGVLQLMQKLVSQMKRKIDPFVPLLAVLVVSVLESTPSLAKVCLLRLSELMAMYHQTPRWAEFLAPIVSHLQEHLIRSSSVELSSVFRMVTSWASHAELLPLYSILSPVTCTLFQTRAYSGTPATALFSMILTLCGEDELEASNVSASYAQSRKQMIRSLKWNNDPDSDDEVKADKGMVVDGASPAASLVVLENAGAILAIVAQSLTSGDTWLQLRVTMAIARLGTDLPSEVCLQLLTLLGEMVAPIAFEASKKRTKKLASEKACVLFQAIHELVQKTEKIPSDLLIKLSRPLLGFDDVLGRLLLSKCIMAVTEKIALEEIECAKILVELNSVKASASLQPDVDRHVDVLQDLLDREDPDLFKSIHLIRHCLFLVSSSACDSTVRLCAERFLFSVPGPDPGLQLMVLNSVHRLLDSHGADGPFRSGLKILIQYVKLGSGFEGEHARLFHQDLLPFTKPCDPVNGIAVGSLLEELLHIQKHKRTRAFKKIVDADGLSDYTKSKLIVPMAFEMIVQPGTSKAAYDMAMCDAGIRAVEICSNKIEILIALVKKYLRKFEEREKPIFRAISKVTEFVRLNGIAVDLTKLQSSLVPQLKRRVWDAKGGVKQDRESGTRHKLAGHEEEDAGLVKLDVVVALLEVMKLLPSSEFEAGMPQVVSLILRGLPSRDLLNRKAAREGLRKCARAMGVGKLAWMMKQVRLAVPKGGYQASVAVFTGCAIFEAATDALTVSLARETSLQLAEEVIEFLRIEDRHWASMQSQAVGVEGEKVPNQCIEARKQRGHELVELSSKFLHPEVVTGVLLRSMYGLLNSLDVEVDFSEDDQPDDIQASSESSDSEDGSASKPSVGGKRKIKLVTSKRDTQLNACFGKKFFSRVDAAVTAVVSGIAENVGYSQTDRMAVCVQSFAALNELLSNRPLEDSDLFARNELPPNVFDLDNLEEDESVVKSVSVKKSRIEKLKEAMFLVQPGASTGRGHWVTEEWKRGKVSSRNDKSGKAQADLRQVKVKLLGVVALRILNQQLSTSDEMSGELRKLLGKFVTRSFCSGVSELFQLSAKSIGKLLNEDVFNAKALGMITRKLISAMEQIHSSGSDVSFITLKAQKKLHQAEVASTCSTLLLSLVSLDSSEWMKQDMREALAAHVLASLDSAALQLPALLILRKILSTKSATIYDCLNKVGELVTTAPSEKVAAIAGLLYGKFLVDFPHSESALMTKVQLLLQQAQTAGAAMSRCTALNTLHAFVKALTCRQVQDQFGELIVVTLSARMASEETELGKQMIVEIVGLALAKFLDSQRRLAVCDAIADWATRMTKWQFLIACMEISCRVFVPRNWIPQPRGCEIVKSVLRQLPFLDKQVQCRGLLTSVQAISALLDTPSESTGPLVQFVGCHLLNDGAGMDPLVIREALTLVHSLSLRVDAKSFFSEDETEAILDQQTLGPLSPWPLLMRVLKLLTSGVVEHQLDLATLAMKTIANLLPLSVGKGVEAVVVERVEEVEETPVELGLFEASKRVLPTSLDERIASPKWTGDRDELERLGALLKKIRYEVRSLMAKSRESVIRLASLLKLAAALSLSSAATSSADILPVSLEILVRLATINKTAEEVSTEIPEINSLFELSTLRPIQQIGCLSKMSNTALEALERHYARSDLGAFFMKQVTAVTTTINADRKSRKISLLNLAISNPARLAMLRLQKSKKKSVKSQASKKESIKRMHGLVH